RDPLTTEKKGEVVTIDPGVTDKRLCVIEPEFARVLKMWTREGNVLSTVIRDAWDGRDVLRTLTRNSPEVATRPHVSIIGHSTPEDLRAYLCDIDLANGTANRFLLLA